MTKTVSLPRDTGADAVEAEATAWVMRLAEDPSTEPECARWRAADPAHEAAFLDAKAIWTLAPDLGEVMGEAWRFEADAIASTPASRLSNWMMLGRGRIVLPVALAASLVAAILVPQLVESPVTEIQTAVAQTQVVALDDGSQVTLGAHSTMSVAIDASERRVVLQDGQAFFEVAHDLSRPFVVVAGNAEIRVTGTKFDVRRIGEDVRVSVLEGRVELRRRSTVGLTNEIVPERVLTAGLRAELDDGRIFTPETQVPVTPGEWRTGRLYYSEAPLREIVADMQRYSAVPIRIAQPRMGDIRVTTSFRSADVDGFIANIEAALPVDGRRTPDGAIVLTAR